MHDYAVGSVAADLRVGDQRGTFGRRVQLGHRLRWCLSVSIGAALEIVITSVGIVITYEI